MLSSGNDRRPARARYVAGLIVLAVSHFALGQVGLSLSHPGTRTILVWPQAGLALAAVLVWGYRVWPAIALGGVAVAIAEGHGLVMWMSTAASNTLAAVAGAWAMRRWGGLGGRLVGLERPGAEGKAGLI